MNDTLKDYDQLWQKKKNDLNHRLRSLYSYDIKDNADFKRSQKTEKFIRERIVTNMTAAREAHAKWEAERGIKK